MGRRAWCSSFPTEVCPDRFVGPPAIRKQTPKTRLDEVLGFLETQARHFADGLDDVDLVRAEILEDDGELGLLFDRSRSSGRAGRGRRSRSRRGHAIMIFQRLDQVVQLKDGQIV